MGGKISFQKKYGSSKKNGKKHLRIVGPLVSNVAHCTLGWHSCSVHLGEKTFEDWGVWASFGVVGTVDDPGSVQKSQPPIPTLNGWTFLNPFRKSWDFN